ncbi:hypothetical protein FKO01_05025 [Mesorhizobium sp. B2-3-3]|nr:hypothetical protein FKO01_05025 [Mesorhizobium sp. B2-3-3]
MTSQAKWKLRNPQAVRAHSAVQHAVKRGLLIRRPCKWCGAERVDGHHTDYSKPLAVVFLCRRCHRRAHHLALFPKPKRGRK